MRAVPLTILAVLTSLFFTGHANAAAQCGNYGNEAAAQAQRSDELKCGFGGAGDPRFWNDPKGHARWCVRASQESVDAEKAARGHSISKCAMCRDYSNAANAAMRENLAFRCGFGDGARWSSGDGGPNDGHFSWCMNQREHDAGLIITYGYTLPQVKTSRLDPETDARTAAIKDCKAKIAERFSETEVKFCRDYARTAFADANINVAKKCGATAVSRWSQNEREHFEACIPIVGTESGKDFLTKEEEFRRRGVDACVEKGAKISADGTFIYKHVGRRTPATASTKDIEQKIRPAGGDNTSTDPGTGKRSTGAILSKGGSIDPRKGGGTAITSGGGGSSAMDRLSGGAGGGDNRSYSGTSEGRPAAPAPNIVRQPAPSGGCPTCSGGENLSYGNRPSGGESLSYGNRR